MALSSDITRTALTGVLSCNSSCQLYGPYVYCIVQTFDIKVELES